MTEETRKATGRVTWWLLMGASCAALAFLWAVVRVGALLESLRAGPGPDRKDVYPGEMPVYAPSDFRSMDERRDT